MRIVSPTRVEIDRGDLLGIAAAAAAGVTLENAVWSIGIDGIEAKTVDAIIASPAIQVAYRIGEARWKKEMEMAITMRIRDPESGSTASNALLAFALKARCNWAEKREALEGSEIPCIVVSGNKLAKVQAAKDAAVRNYTEGDRVEVQVNASSTVSVERGVATVQQPEGKAQERTPQRRGRRRKAEAQVQDAEVKPVPEGKEPWE